MKDLKTLIIVVLTLIIVWLTQCQRVEVPTETIIEYKDSLVYVPQVVTEYLDTTIYLKEVVHDTIKINGAITQYITPEKDYYMKRFYSSQIPIDTLGFITINDTVFKNRIISRDFFTDISYSNMEYKPIKKRSNALYLGFSILGTTQQFNALTGDILLTTKRNAFSVGFGVDENFNYLWKGSIYFKL